MITTVSPTNGDQGVRAEMARAQCRQQQIPAQYDRSRKTPATDHHGPVANTSWARNCSTIPSVLYCQREHFGVETMAACINRLHTETILIGP